MKNDTGLHVAMRLLLGIVAGLLISDMLKVAVKTVDAGAASAAALQSIFAVLAVFLFLIRVVVDNALYYNDRDATTEPEKPAYGLRVLLIGLDLLSYAVCYHMVAEIEPFGGKPFSVGAIMTVAGDMALVEILQFLCCLFAVFGLKLVPEEQTTRKPILARWRDLSAVSAVLFFIVWMLLRNDVLLDPWPGLIVLLAAIASGATYLIGMRRLRYLPLS
jgi:hypothetical protein